MQPKDASYMNAAVTNTFTARGRIWTQDLRGMDLTCLDLAAVKDLVVTGNLEVDGTTSFGSLTVFTNGTTFGGDVLFTNTTGGDIVTIRSSSSSNAPSWRLKRIAPGTPTDFLFRLPVGTEALDVYDASATNSPIRLRFNPAGDTSAISIPAGGSQQMCSPQLVLKTVGDTGETIVAGDTSGSYTLNLNANALQNDGDMLLIQAHGLSVGGAATLRFIVSDGTHTINTGAATAGANVFREDIVLTVTNNGTQAIVDNVLINNAAATSASHSAAATLDITSAITVTAWAVTNNVTVYNVKYTLVQNP